MRFLVLILDDVIRKSTRVFEFSQDANCILRLQVTRAPHTLQLPDLTLEAGEPVFLIHLWNERLPVYAPGGADLTWARRMLYLFSHSLRLVAGYLSDDPKLGKIRAVGGITILLTAGLHEGGSRLVQDMGFTVTPYFGRLGRFGEFWENFYSLMTIWTFNPHSLPHRSLFRLRRSELWMSREAFLKRFGKTR